MEVRTGEGNGGKWWGEKILTQDKEENFLSAPMNRKKKRLEKREREEKKNGGEDY